MHLFPLVIARLLAEPARFRSFTAFTPIPVTTLRCPLKQNMCALASSPSENSDSGRKYLNVPFAEKEKAKALGARWDPNFKKWYDPGPQYNPELDRWKGSDSTIVPSPSGSTNDIKVFKPETKNRKYLSVPFKEKDEAKSLGAKWDSQAKLWYDPSGSDQVHQALLRWAVTASNDTPLASNNPPPAS